MTQPALFDFSVITGKTVDRVIRGDLVECVRIVREAYLAHEAGDSINPNSYFLRYPEKPSSRIIALPAHLGGETNVSGIKWIASFPENVGKGFPRASAVLVLNSYETGYPFACLESSIISAARTAASAVVAADAVRKGQRRIQTLGIVGTGLIARYVYDFLVGTGWEIDAVALFDTKPEEAARFKAALETGGQTRVTVHPHAGSLISSSDVVVFTTVAASPHVADFELFLHNPLVLHLSLRDLSPEILLRSNNVVDDVGHVMNASTSPHLAEQQVGHRGFVNGTIAAAVKGKCDLDPTRPTIVSPFGLGVLDLAVGKWVYDVARASGEAIMVDEFFHETQR